MDNTNRIEALRAASRIVAGSAASGCGQKDKDTGEQMGFAEGTILLADRFLKWLEASDTEADDECRPQTISR